LSTSHLYTLSLHDALPIYHLEANIRERLAGVRDNGAPGYRLPNIANLSFERIEGEAAVIAMDLEGVAVSTGSACASGSLEPSHRSEEHTSELQSRSDLVCR